MADVLPGDVYLILMCSSTGDDHFGSASVIQKALGWKSNPLAFDITAACSGFLLGLFSASCYIKDKAISKLEWDILYKESNDLSVKSMPPVDYEILQPIKVAPELPAIPPIGSSSDNEQNTSWVVMYSDADWVGEINDRNSTSGYILYLGVNPISWSSKKQCTVARSSTEAEYRAVASALTKACDIREDGLFSFDLHSDGDGKRHLISIFKENETDDASNENHSVTSFPPKCSSYSYLQINVKEIFKFVVRVVPQSIEAALEKTGLASSNNFDWLLLHQAKQRIIDGITTWLEVPLVCVISNLANYGNTSVASIPLALDKVVRSGKVQSGHVIAAAGFGAGLTWASTIFRWG
ncbi:3-oxoacyl-[acyl-carrier-protein] synthase III, chloroplastic [Capsicum annuum]|nr:3-oxoacyl-[acyl-carrier-protein] synthase III, chloroplastic [Capsicum annuum]